MADLRDSKAHDDRMRRPSAPIVTNWSTLCTTKEAFITEGGSMLLSSSQAARATTVFFSSLMTLSTLAMGADDRVSVDRLSLPTETSSTSSNFEAAGHCVGYRYYCSQITDRNRCISYGCFWVQRNADNRLIAETEATEVNSCILIPAGGTYIWWCPPN